MIVSNLLAGMAFGAVIGGPVGFAGYRMARRPRAHTEPATAAADPIVALATEIGRRLTGPPPMPDLVWPEWPPDEARAMLDAWHNQSVS